MEPIFEQSILGTKTLVYADRFVWRPLWGVGEKIIPIKQIASVEEGLPFQTHIMINTVDGKSHKITVFLEKKKELKEALMRAMSA